MTTGEQLIDMVAQGAEVPPELLTVHSVQHTDANGRSALHIAAMHGRVYAVVDLLAAGSCPLTADMFGNSPWCYARTETCAGQSIHSIIYTAARAQPFAAISLF